MDFLSPAWCNFAVQAFQPDLQDLSLVLRENSTFKNDTNSPFLKIDNSVKMDDADRPIPPWKSNDVKLPWKMLPSIKKWLKEIKQKRKEDQRLQRAEVHAAISVAGVASALAAIAAENSKRDESGTTKESAVASAAALVAAQCAQVAEAMGAKREQLSTVIGSAMSGTGAIDILTLTAAATTCNDPSLTSLFMHDGPVNAI
ncbi:hypothetical protein F0562_009226 [Nyssa sinensis]|uniref:VAN3-binding protein-like auxin canalisation domain-containing protein n=1 Tax=Nyssa sinensis TaxID=561372 RepID=A0A5J4ZVE2_9ASTE|nr:hypothetical protein F0562_009226 [Nyssa sinensis]